MKNGYSSPTRRLSVVGKGGVATTGTDFGISY